MTCSATTDYNVEFTQRAEFDLKEIYREKRAAESQAAYQWLVRLRLAIDGLETLPHRCPLAPDLIGTHREMRQLLYGQKPHIYRVLYEIDENQHVVRVLTIRHGARRHLGTVGES